MAGSFIFVLMALKNLMSKPAIIVNIIAFFVSGKLLFTESELSLEQPFTEIVIMV